jgi:Lon protease-like protein
VDSSHVSLAQLDLSRVGLFPLPNVVLFPAQLLALHVFEPRYRRLIRDVISQQLPLAVPRLEPGFDAAYYGAPPVHELCGVGELREYTELPDGCYNIIVRGLGRVRLVEELRSHPYRVARAEIPAQAPADAAVSEVLRAELVKQLRRVAAHLQSPAQNLEARMSSDIGSCADIVAGTLIEDPDQRQQLLEELDPCRRASWLIAHLHGQARDRGAPRAPAQLWNLLTSLTAGRWPLATLGAPASWPHAASMSRPRERRMLSRLGRRCSTACTKASSVASLGAR